MNCRYCQAQNDADAHRCDRCGRRLGDERSAFPVQRGALAPVLEPEYSSEPAPRPGPQLVTELSRTTEERQGPGVQGVLFGPMEVSRPATQRSAARSASTPAQPRKRADPNLQARLEFETPESLRRPQRPGEAIVPANAPVAIAAHRSIAALVDFAVPLAGWAIVAATFHVAVGDIDFSRETAPYHIAIYALLSLLYRTLGCFGDADSFGLQFSGLQLVNFDGRRPTRRQRFLRLAGGCVSLISVGIGLLWGLLDEERLTWHDYMSKTFPAPRVF